MLCSYPTLLLFLIILNLNFKFTLYCFYLFLDIENISIIVIENSLYYIYITSIDELDILSNSAVPAKLSYYHCPKLLQFISNNIMVSTILIIQHLRCIKKVQAYAIRTMFSIQ